LTPAISSLSDTSDPGKGIDGFLGQPGREVLKSIMAKAKVSKGVLNMVDRIRFESSFFNYDHSIMVADTITIDGHSASSFQE